MDLPDPSLAEQTELPGRGRWVFFDGDNTLWHVEALYDRARHDLVRHIESAGGLADEVEAFQRREDKRLFTELGYSAARFAKSFENTMHRFVAAAPTHEIQFARRLALSVFEQAATMDPDVSAVVSELKGHYKLGLITAGEPWVQQRRVAHFAFSKSFDMIRIVNKKTTDVFRRLTTELNVDTHRSWVVGDSLRSDILPAIAAGLNAILIANHNWVEVERDETGPRHLNVVDSLKEILPILTTARIDIAVPGHA
jgi:putative hydrolase of the HAD superfamily